LVCRFILFNQLWMRTLWHHHQLQTIYPLDNKWCDIS
jgi:hypothetical protein